jgi:hypothetical protein
MWQFAASFILRPSFLWGRETSTAITTTSTITLEIYLPLLEIKLRSSFARPLYSPNYWTPSNLIFRHFCEIWIRLNQMFHHCTRTLNFAESEVSFSGYWSGFNKMFRLSWFSRHLQALPWRWWLQRVLKRSNLFNIHRTPQKSMNRNVSLFFVI